MSLRQSKKSLIMDFFFIFTVLFCLIHSIEAGKDKNYCNVCRAVLQEANWKISQSDQTKTIQVGSFRVDPKGNQNIKEKNYARSEGHIEEIFESICDEMGNYAELNQDGTTTIVRTSGRHGKRLDTKGYDLNMDAGQRLLYQCHDFLENHEEDVMKLLQLEDVENYEQDICWDETNVCTGEELSVPFIELPEAVEEPVEVAEEDKNEDLGSVADIEDLPAETDQSEGDSASTERLESENDTGKDEL